MFFGDAIPTSLLVFLEKVFTSFYHYSSILLLLSMNYNSFKFHCPWQSVQPSLQSVERMVTMTRFAPDSDTDQAVFAQQETSYIERLLMVDCSCTQCAGVQDALDMLNNWSHS